MTLRSIIALLACAALVSPSAAQTRIAAGLSRGPAGIPLVPALGDYSSPVEPSLNGGLLAPSMISGFPSVTAPALLAPVLPTTSVPSLRAGPAKTVRPTTPTTDGASTAVDELRAEGEKFWSGAAARDETSDALPGGAPPVGKTPSLLTRGVVLSPAFAVLPSIPHWASAAAPYAGGAAALAGAYVLNRVSRWALDKAADRFGWDRNVIVMARFISSIVLWTAGAGVGLISLGMSGTALLATFGAGGTAMALAITLAVRDVAGNLFHGVHFLLARPFTVGDKVTIGKTTGVVHDLALRYLVLQDEAGTYILYTYNGIAAAGVKLYGEYQTKELRLRLRLSLSRLAFPRGLLHALRGAAPAAVWKPILFSALAIAALSFLPMLPAILNGASLAWLGGGLPYLKAGVIAVLTGSLSGLMKAAIERLAPLYGWTRPVTTVAKLGVAMMAWIIGGSFLFNAIGVSWTWVFGALSLSTVLVSIAVNDYVNSIFQGFLVLTLKPFLIGDRVTIGENAGTVVDITLQYVVLKLDSESFMLIPHSVVKDSAIFTPREYGQRRK